MSLSGGQVEPHEHTFPFARLQVGGDVIVTNRVSSWGAHARADATAGSRMPLKRRARSILIGAQPFETAACNRSA